MQAETLCKCIVAFVQMRCVAQTQGGLPKGCATRGVDGGMVVGKVHEAVYQVWLAHVCG